MAGLLCEEEVLEVDNVKYCGYCKYHFNKMVSFFIPALEGFGHVKALSSSKIASGLQAGVPQAHNQGLQPAALFSHSESLRNKD